MQSTKPTWASINFIQAATFSVMTFNEVNKHAYTANASSEFVHTSPDGPLMRLAYDDKAAMIALDAYVPEDHDLTIGRVLGVDESGSVDKRSIWSSATDGGKALTALEAVFHTLLFKEDEEQLECGNTYEFYWIDNARSETDAGSWTQTIDCSPKIAGNETIGAQPIMTETFAVTSDIKFFDDGSANQYSSVDHPLVKDPMFTSTSSNTTYSSGVWLNPRSCSTTCKFTYHSTISCSNINSSGLHWTLTCTPTSSNSVTQYQTCNTSKDGTLSIGQDWLSPCTRSNSVAFSSSVIALTTTSASSVGTTSSSSEIEFYWNGSTVKRSNLGTTTTSEVTFSTNTVKYTRTCNTSTTSTGSTLGQFYILPCTISNSTAWNTAFTFYRNYTSATNSTSTATWSRTVISGSRSALTVSSGSATTTVQVRQCFATESGQGSSSPFWISMLDCVLSLQASITTVWTKDTFTTTTYSTTTSSTSVTYIQMVYMIDRSTTSNNSSTTSTRVCNTAGTIDYTNYLTNGGACPTNASTNPFTVNTFTDTSSTETDSGSIVYFKFYTNTYTRTSNFKTTSETSTRSCYTSNVAQNLYISPCTTSNSTVWDDSFSEVRQTSVTGSICSKYTFYDQLMSGSRSTSGALDSVTTSTYRSWTCVTSSYATNMYVYPCSAYNTTAFDTTFSWTTYQTYSSVTTPTTTTISTGSIEFIRVEVSGTRTLPTDDYSSSAFSVSSTDKTSTTRSCLVSDSLTNLYITPCTLYNTTAWNDTQTVYFSYSTTGTSTITWARATIIGTRSESTWSLDTSTTSTRTCKTSSPSTNLYIIPCSTGNSTAWYSGFSIPTYTTTTTSSSVYFYRTILTGTRTSSSTSTTTDYTYCYTTTTTTLWNSVVVTPSECTTGHDSPWEYWTSWDTDTTCNRMSCTFKKKFSWCTSSWSCDFDSTSTRICNKNHPSTGLQISPCSASNTTAWDDTYTKWTDSTVDTTTSTKLSFKMYLYAFTRTSDSSTSTQDTSTRTCTTSMTTHPYLTTCTSDQLTAVFSLDTYVTTTTWGECDFTSTGSSTIMECSFYVYTHIYTRTSETETSSTTNTIYTCLTTSTTGDLLNMTTCRPEASFIFTYSFSETLTSCSSTYTTQTTSNGTVTNTNSYSQCSFTVFESKTGCLSETGSDCVDTASIYSFTCNSYTWSGCSSGNFKAFWYSTSMSHTRCNFPTTISGASTESGTTICCYWDGTFGLTTNSTFSSGTFTSSSVSSVFCTVSNSSGSTYQCASTTYSSGKYIGFTCSYSEVDACTSLRSECSSSVFTTNTSICCLYSITTSKPTVSSTVTYDIDDRCCQISYSLTYTTTSTTTTSSVTNTFTNTNTFTTTNCCRTYSTPCETTMNTSTCSSSYITSTCDSTCLSVCFLGLCVSSCSVDLSSGCLNVAYQTVSTASMTLCTWVYSVSPNTTNGNTASCDNASTSSCVYLWFLDSTSCGCTSTCSSTTCSTVTFSHGQWKDCYTTCSSGGYSTDESKDEIKNIFDGDDIGEMMEIFNQNLFILFTGSWMDFD